MQLYCIWLAVQLRASQGIELRIRALSARPERNEGQRSVSPQNSMRMLTFEFEREYK